MSVGKSSISRMTKAAQKTEGIVSLAPEVPVGDAATPAPAKKTPAKKTPAKKAPAKKAAPAPKTIPAQKAVKIPTIEIGGELPYWLL
jgi:hypothetical protein